MNVVGNELLQKISGGIGTGFEAPSNGRFVFIKNDHTARQREAIKKFNKSELSGFFMDIMSGGNPSLPLTAIPVDSP